MIKFNKLFYYQLLILILTSYWLISETREAQRIIFPCIVLINVTVYFFITLWKRDRVVPLFELGSLFVIACVLYTLIPALGFISNHLEYTSMSSIELNELAPNAKQLEPLVWRYVIFDVCFALIYLWCRGKKLKLKNITKLPPKNTFFSLLVLIVSTELLFLVYGLSTRSSYDKIADVYDSAANMSLIQQQIFGHLYSIALAFKIYFIVLIVSKSPEENRRRILITCIFAIIAIYFTYMGSRTETVVLLVTCGLLYHRLVKPVGFIIATLGSFFLILGFLLIGLMRAGSDFKTNFELLKLTLDSDISLLQIANEFQNYFAYNYNLLVMKQTGILDVPTQLYFYDVLLPLPQQLLPFAKMNPTFWYWQYSETKGFFTFNPIAQAIVGGDWIDLVVRGGLLGCLFASAHKWYLRRSDSMVSTFIYLYIVVYSYYSIKDSSFILVYYVIYKLIPALIAIKLSGSLLQKNKNKIALSKSI